MKSVVVLLQVFHRVTKSRSSIFAETRALQASKLGNMPLSKGSVSCTALNHKLCVPAYRVSVDRKLVLKIAKYMHGVQSKQVEESMVIASNGF